jgi:hypothetical protein
MANISLYEHCTDNRHVQGEWGRINVEERLFECFNEFNTSDTHRNENAFNYYRREGACYGGDTRQIKTSLGCNCEDDLDHNRVHDRERYQWEPALCNLVPWDATQFCSLLGNRTILMLGDSAMQQAATTLMSMVVAGGGSCAPQLTCYRSDFLFPSLEYCATMRHPNVTIFNAGAHMRDIGGTSHVWDKITPIIRCVYVCICVYVYVCVCVCVCMSLTAPHTHTHTQSHTLTQNHSHSHAIRDLRASFPHMKLAWSTNHPGNQLYKISGFNTYYSI